MPSPTTDFAPPIVKTIGCFVALISFPAALFVHLVAQNPLPTVAYIASAGIFIAGLGALIGQPRSIDQVIRVSCAMLCRRKR